MEQARGANRKGGPSTTSLSGQKPASPSPQETQPPQHQGSAGFWCCGKDHKNRTAYNKHRKNTKNHQQPQSTLVPQPGANPTLPRVSAFRGSGRDTPLYSQLSPAQRASRGILGVSKQQYPHLSSPQSVAAGQPIAPGVLPMPADMQVGRQFDEKLQAQHQLYLQTQQRLMLEEPTLEPPPEPMEMDDGFLSRLSRQNPQTSQSAQFVSDLVYQRFKKSSMDTAP